MIIGIGNDIIEIERVRKACVKEAFLCRIFTEKEIAQSKRRASYLAGNFSVKEAVAKSFGTGFRGFDVKEIEVLRDDLGKPYVTLYHRAESIARELGIISLHVAISNSDTLVFATAVAEGR